MAAKKIKQGTVLVMSDDVFSEEVAVLLSSTDDKIFAFYLREEEIISISRNEYLENIKKGVWLERVPDIL
jgi:hypothetical protein